MTSSSSEASNIKFLSKIFKIDLASFISTELNETNFLEYHTIIHDIIDSFSKEPLQNSSSQLQVSCDRILNLCLETLFKSDEHNQLLLKFFRECTPYCSFDTFNKLYKCLLIYFIKLAQSKGKGKL